MDFDASVRETSLRDFYTGVEVDGDKKLSIFIITLQTAAEIAQSLSVNLVIEISCYILEYNLIFSRSY